MKKLNLTIVIPTRNRLKLLTKTLMHLKKNNFFFRKIIIVDSSDKENKTQLNELKLTYDFKIINSTPGISKQRNEGLKNVNKNSKYVMFLDDDIVFEKNSIIKMYNFLKLNPKCAGVGFNLIIKNMNKYVESIKLKKTQFIQYGFFYISIYKYTDHYISIFYQYKYHISFL